MKLQVLMMKKCLRQALIILLKQLSKGTLKNTKEIKHITESINIFSNDSDKEHIKTKCHNIF